MTVLFFTNHQYPHATIEGKRQDFPYNRGVAWRCEDGYFASGLDDKREPLSVPGPNRTLEGLKQWVNEAFGCHAPAEKSNNPGIFYPRIHRQVVSSCNPPLGINLDSASDSFVAVRILVNRLEELSETVDPTEKNNDVYGHKIRELLLLACMEVESAWKAVLKEHSYAGDRWTTNDYVKLYKPMVLDVYSLRLHAHSSYPAFAPFKGWDVGSPTKSLPWYEAYNLTKHDREVSMSVATLKHAVSAVGAAVVMLYAQFGNLLKYEWFASRASFIESVFEVQARYAEKHEELYYVPPVRLLSDPHEGPYLYQDEWTAHKYPF